MFDLDFTIAASPAAPASYAVPAGVIIGAFLAGLFSLVTLIITKENKVSEFRQTWIDAQRGDIATVLAVSSSLAQAPLDKRADHLFALDAAYARILLRDNPLPSFKPEGRFNRRLTLRRSLLFLGWSAGKSPRLPWKNVTRDIWKLRQLLSEPAINRHEVLACQTRIIEHSRILLKEEWTIVKQGEWWYALTRHAIGGLLLTSAIVFSAYISIYYVIYPLLSWCVRNAGSIFNLTHAASWPVLAT